jgi:ribonuclease P protein component
LISRHRLRGRRRFAAVRAEGQRASVDGVRVQLAGNGLDVARVGFALVGLRSAVARNRLRRRLRSAITPLLPQLAGHDLVFVAGTEALGHDSAELGVAVAAAAGRALDRSRRAQGASTADNGAMTPPMRPRR